MNLFFKSSFSIVLVAEVIAKFLRNTFYWGRNCDLLPCFRSVYIRELDLIKLSIIDNKSRLDIYKVIILENKVVN